MIPYHDENQTQRTPIVTIALIAITTLTWIVVQGAGSALAVARSVCDLGLIPGELTESVPPGTSFRSQRASCASRIGSSDIASLHLDVPARFLDAPDREHVVPVALRQQRRGCDDAVALRRLLSVVRSGRCHHAGRGRSHVGGADGRRLGCDQWRDGRYLVLFPRVRVWTIIPLGFYPHQTAVPAWVMLIYWMVLQFVGGITSVVAEESGGVAFWAHLGGFVAGVVLIKVFVRRDHVAAHVSGRWSPREAGWR